MKSNYYKSEIGELACGQMQHKWYRGVTLTLSPVILIAAIDEARTCIPIKVLPIPKNYKIICTYGLTSKFLANVKVSEGKIKVLF